VSSTRPKVVNNEGKSLVIKALLDDISSTWYVQKWSIMKDMLYIHHSLKNRILYQSETKETKFLSKKKNGNKEYFTFMVLELFG